MTEVIERSPQKTILIVDDELYQHGLLSAQLKALGYDEILIATSREEALPIATTRKPDLCITDNSMPNSGDGIRLIEQYPNAYETPFIIRSASLEDITGDIARLRDQGLVIGTLRKPNNMVNLGRVIDEVTTLSAARLRIRPLDTLR